MAATMFCANEKLVSYGGIISQTPLLPYINHWDRRMPCAQSLHIRRQLQRLFVFAVPNARVHQLRQLKYLQQLCIASQRQRVQASSGVDFRTGADEFLASRRQVGHAFDQRVQLLFGGTKLAENVLGALGCLDERRVVADGQILGLFDDGPMLVGQMGLFLLQLVHFVGAQLEEVRLDGGRFGLEMGCGERTRPS